jgi:hypothetical protein
VIKNEDKGEKNDSEEAKEKEPGFCVLVHLNIPHEEDFVFLITALYHWEQKYPIYSNKLHKNVNEIVKKVKTPKKPLTSESLPPIQPVQ